MAPEIDGTIRFHAVPDEVEKHPAGTLRILNFSSYAAAVAINKDQYQAAIGATDTVVPFGSGGTLIQSAIQKDGKWVPVYRRERIARSRLHTYGLVFNFISEPGAEDIFPPPTSFTLLGELPPQPVARPN